MLNLNDMRVRFVCEPMSIIYSRIVYEIFENVYRQNVIWQGNSSGIKAHSLTKHFVNVVDK